MEERTFISKKVQIIGLFSSFRHVFFTFSKCWQVFNCGSWGEYAKQRDVVASEVSEKGLAWHEELKTDVVTEGEAPTWHLIDETANESFGRLEDGVGYKLGWLGLGGGKRFFFLGGGGVAKRFFWWVTTKWSCLVSHFFGNGLLFFFSSWGQRLKRTWT